ncbi:hypothetical protein [Anaeromicrobium sediminis]|nr:hypothetical protein [Anaeromicrobium sediminis]
MFQSYDEISKYILGLLNSSSQQILLIDGIIYNLLVNTIFNDHIEFQEFMNEWNDASYYHFQCEGYMKTLVVTKCYSHMSIYYFINNLIIPAEKHFAESLKHFSKIKVIPELTHTEQFKLLPKKVDDLKKIAIQIKEGIKLYSL